MTVRLVIVDDHPVVRAGLVALLGGEADLEVVGQASGGEEAVQQVAALHPDVVLMDLQLGAGIDGVETTRRVLALPEPPRIIVLTTYDSDADIMRAVEAGATGYLLKDAAPEELIRAIRGEAILSPAVASRLVGQLRRPSQPAPTAREIEILELLARGLTNREISKALFISEATVKTHLVHIYAKLGVDTRTAAVAAAVEHRLIRMP